MYVYLLVMTAEGIVNKYTIIRLEKIFMYFIKLSTGEAE